MYHDICHFYRGDTINGNVSGIRPVQGSAQASEAAVPQKKVKRVFKFKNVWQLLLAAFGTGIAFGAFAYLNDQMHFMAPLNPFITGVIGVVIIFAFNYADLVSAYGT